MILKKTTLSIVGVISKFLLILMLVSSCSVFNGLLRDFDRDGIADVNDPCPDTPAGVAVDENGCPLDTDNDGIADYLDRCPDTPLGCPVESDGCSLDSDGDGVIDCIDHCPDIAGAIESQGCPLLMAEMPLPDFPDIMPQPSDKLVIDKVFFQNCQMLGDFENKLNHALQSNGYKQPGYYQLGDQSQAKGFAMITPLEQIFGDGESKPDEYRWSLEDSPRFLRGFSIKDYLSILLNGDPGYYRSFVFIVSDEPVRFETMDVPIEIITELADDGGDWLPDDIKTQLADAETYKCLCLVYHFKKDDVTHEVSFLKPGPVSCENHLKKSGIWKTLQEE